MVGARMRSNNDGLDKIIYPFGEPERENRRSEKPIAITEVVRLIPVSAGPSYFGEMVYPVSTKQGACGRYTGRQIIYLPSRARVEPDVSIPGKLFPYLQCVSKENWRGRRNQLKTRNYKIVQQKLLRSSLTLLEEQ